MNQKCIRTLTLLMIPGLGKKAAYIISDDGVFRLTAIAQDITPLKSTEFIDSHKQ